MHGNIPVVLSIAGSDNTAGAGIQADIKTCSACGVYCATVITAVTAQNPSGLKNVHYVGKDALQSQLEATIDCIRPKAVKIGMIPNFEAAAIIGEFLDKYKFDNVVIDPVLSATSGGDLFFDSCNCDNKYPVCELFPYASLITPNIPECLKLIDKSDTEIDNIVAAQTLLTRVKPASILLKGGHSNNDICDDILFSEDRNPVIFSEKRIETNHTHGTGCTLSSAIASYLLRGYDIEVSIAKAKKFVTDSIARAKETPLFPSASPLLQYDIKMGINVKNVL